MNFLRIRKAQSATEYLIILAVVIVVIGILMGSAYQMLNSGQIKTRRLQAEDLIDELGKASELVYQEGQGAMTKIYVTIPPGMENYRRTGTMIFFNVSLGGDTTPFVYPLNFPYTINLSKTPGSYWMNVTSNGTGVIIE